MFHLVSGPQLDVSTGRQKPKLVKLLPKPNYKLYDVIRKVVPCRQLETYLIQVSQCY